MKDAKGHGSNPRGAHSAGVEKIGLMERTQGAIMKGAWAREEQGYAVRPGINKTALAHASREVKLDNARGRVSKFLDGIVRASDTKRQMRAAGFTRDAQGNWSRTK